MGNKPTARGWHERRFDGPRPKAVEASCQQCARPYWLPASKVSEYPRCSKQCNDAWRAERKLERQRSCATCGGQFHPRWSQLNQGHGQFCSQRCNTAASAAITSPENLAKAQERQRQLRREGGLVAPKGPDNKRWKGGPKACRERRTADGRDAATQRAYRAANLEKRKEWERENRSRRREQKGGRLPRGTIPRIGEQQGWRCAVCRVSIKETYHADHISPLARGGLHVARNIQLLCPPCNLSKGAKDPADFMRQRGLLV